MYIVCHLLCSNLIFLNVTYKDGHKQVSVSHGYLATTELCLLDYLYILYSSVARQQGAHLILVFFFKKKILFENIVYI